MTIHIATHSSALAPFGGIEVSTVEDAVALAARGHTVDMFYGADGPLHAKYENAGVLLHGPVSFGFSRLHAVRDVARFAPSVRWARSRRPEVLWLNRFEHIFWGRAVATGARCPVVCQLHHLPNYRRVYQGVLARGVDHFVAVSDFIRERWVESGIPPELISTVHNAVPDQNYPYGGAAARSLARQALGLDEDVPIVLYYGRMIVEKGVQTLVEAWGRLAADRRGLLLLVGSPDLDSDARIRQAVADLPCGASVRWIPETVDVLPFLHAADVVAFPTQLPEAFGRVAIEAMSTGRPVVASRIGAVPEVLSGDMAEFLFDPGSAEQLTGRLDELLDWRRTRPELGQKCADFVRNRFPYATHVNALEQVLDRHRRR